jgi:hypothetical protein
MGRLLILFALVDVTILVVALIDCLSVPAEGIRALPRAVWALIIIIFTPVGGIAWFLAGRPVAEHAQAVGAAPVRRDAPTTAPDDDPEFLRTLGASAQFTREDAELMRQWEADLRRREDEQRRDGERDVEDPDTPR